MAATSKPSTPLPPGVVPSESRDDFNDLVDGAKEKLDEKDPNNIIKEVGQICTVLEDVAGINRSCTTSYYS